MNHHTNKVRIRIVANALEDLKEKVVFVGGATISLYTQVGLDVRPTDDVDVIIEILNYAGLVALEEKLRMTGFENDVHSGVICRWRIQGIIVDIMPTNDTSVGISNIWYPEGFSNAVDCIIDESCTVKILSAPYFIATKMEAFKSRGKYDGRMSQDFEDIIYVLENRQTIWDEINESKGRVRDYLQAEFRKLCNHPDIIEWVDCHVERVSLPATYYIIDQLEIFTAR